MVVQDLWYLKERGPDKKRLPSKRHGRGKRWRVPYTDPNTGKETSESFNTKTEAELFENNIKADISRGVYVDPKAGQITVAEYAEQYRHRPMVRDGTRENMERNIRLHITPVFGGLAMAQVRQATLQNWIINRRTKPKNPLGASSIRTIWTAVMFPMFAQAVVDGIIGRNPCLGVRLPELPHGEYDIPTTDQLHAVADKLGARYRPIPYLAAQCGWRSGEIFGAELGAIDFLRQNGRVVQQLRELSKGQPYLAPPKSKLSRRDNELPTIARLVLARHIQMFPPKPVRIWDRTDPDKPYERDALLLFTDEKGRPMRRSEWSRAWRAACAAAKIPDDLITLHSFRHFFATVLIYGGENVRTVQRAMGHSKPSITLDSYLGYWPEEARNRARTLVDEAVGTIYTQSVPQLGG